VANLVGRDVAKNRNGWNNEMQHEPSKVKHPYSAGRTGQSAVKEAERRGSERHTVTTSAEVVEQITGARFSTRTTDLGPGGCFIDCTVPFPVGCKLRVNLQKGKSNFATSGTVVYSQSGLGMGISFDELNDDDRSSLSSWLEHVTGEKMHLAEPHRPAAPAYSGATTVTQNPALVRLVQLLIGKGLLTEAEGASVLFDPVL
jgi:hypothetical protein